MKNNLGETKLLLVRLSIALLTYPVTKILFYLFNYSYFSDVSFGNFLLILFYGLRFDISAVVMINAVFILFHIMPFAFTKHKWYAFLLKTVFVFSNSVAILANCIDLEYYKYTLKRTTADFFSLFGLGSDISTLLPQYVKDFWYVVLIWIALTVLIAWLYPNPKGSNTEKTAANSFSPFRVGVWLLFNSLLIGLLLIGFRGGLQLKPILPINAAEYVSAKNIPLVVNTPFSILKTLEMEKIEEKKYFSEEELNRFFNPIQTVRNTGQSAHSPNIFLIILESFSKEYTGLGKRKSYTPFLDSLMNESLVFENAFANGKKSIEGIPAIVAGIPALMNEAFITSTYCSNQFNSPALLLKKKGYTSAFFHGGTNGTMGFDAFCGSAGYDNYFGRHEYNNEKDYDGNWGIWDEEFFQYTRKKISGMKQPFFATLFSLTSHHPYPVPEKYKDRFKDGDHPIHKSIQYTDHALKKFFESASKENWFNNTLFLITTDHTGPSSDSYYSNSAGIFAVPILLYKPGSDLRGKDLRIAQHCDIAPTLLSHAGIDEPFFGFGNNLLDSASNRFAVNFINDVYQFFENDHLLQFDGEKTIGFYNFKNDSLLQKNIMGSNAEAERKMEMKLKAIIQVYTSGMINNKLSARRQ